MQDPRLMDRQTDMSNKPMDRQITGRTQAHGQTTRQWDRGDRNRRQTQSVRQIKRSHTGPKAHGQTGRQTDRGGTETEGQTHGVRQMNRPHA